METTTDAQQGGESLSIEQAAAAFVKATSKEAPPSQAEDEEQTESETTDDELPEGDEPDSEEADGEPDPDGQADEESEEEPDTEGGRFVAHDGRVRLPDGSVSTVSDLIAGNMKEKDYRQKTMGHAEEVKRFQSQSAAIEASQKQLDQEREYVKALIEAFTPQQPDISLTDPKSPNFDPVAYNLQLAQYQQYAAHHQNIQSQLSESAKKKAEKEAQDQSERAGKEWQLALEAMPELKDPKRVEAFGNDILKYGPTYGYTREELAQAPNDYRQLMVLKKAIAWDKLQASKANVAKKVEGRPPVQKGGKRLNPGAHRARAATDAMNRLKTSGSVEDATAAWLAHLNKG